LKEKSINLQRTESLLRELIPEALGELSDSRLHLLTITDVDCSNGKYDAKVYFDGSEFSDEELKEVLKLLKKASGRVKSYCLSATGWYKCPNLTFLKDDMLEKSKRIDELFAQIQSTKGKF